MFFLEEREKLRYCGKEIKSYQNQLKVFHYMVVVYICVKYIAGWSLANSQVKSLQNKRCKSTSDLEWSVDILQIQYGIDRQC